MANNVYIELDRKVMGGTVWRINDDNLALDDGVFKIVEKFIAKHQHNDFSLSIYDTLTSGTVEIECKVDAIPSIVSYIYHLEKSTPMAFIGENPESKSYVVGMPLTRGLLLVSREYVDVNGKLELVQE